MSTNAPRWLRRVSNPARPLPRSRRSMLVLQRPPRAAGQPEFPGTPGAVVARTADIAYLPFIKRELVAGKIWRASADQDVSERACAAARWSRRSDRTRLVFVTLDFSSLVSRATFPLLVGP